jgi:hypothetical protein
MTTPRSQRILSCRIKYRVWNGLWIANVLLPTCSAKGPRIVTMHVRPVSDPPE